MPRQWEIRACLSPDKQTGGNPPKAEQNKPQPPRTEEQVDDVGPGLMINAHGTGGKDTLGIIEGDNIPGSEGGG